MSKWIYQPDALDETGAPYNGITNETLLKWIDTYLNPEEWFIEINGGEPGLYPEIEELLIELSKRKYKGLIRTNGSQPLPYSDRIKRLTAWHKGKEFPKYWDHILILQNPDDDWQSKVEYCEENNFSYTVLPYRQYSNPNRPKEELKREVCSKLFTDMTTMFASGRMTDCFSGGVDLENGPTLQKMNPPIVVQPCLTCVNIAGLEKFMLEVPEFKEAYGITDDMTHNMVVYYPMLNAKSQWVDENGNVVGVLGDDPSKFKKERAYLTNSGKKRIGK